MEASNRGRERSKRYINSYYLFNDESIGCGKKILMTLSVRLSFLRTLIYIYIYVHITFKHVTSIYLKKYSFEILTGFLRAN